MLIWTKGDIFAQDFDIRINTVNCVGIMGKGLALKFKKKYPEMFLAYQNACKKNIIKPGKIWVWKYNLDLFVLNYIICFPTKRHWKEKSRYIDIEMGLNDLNHYLINLSFNHPNLKIALPALGCGYGGLNWYTVKNMIKEKLSNINNEIYVFSPYNSL